MRKFDDLRQIRSAERLFDAIGMIDDKMIADKLKDYAQWLDDVTKKRKRQKF